MPHSNGSSHPAVTLSVRVPLESRNQLEELANATGRTKSFLAAKAIEYYLEPQNWQEKAIEKSIKNADSKNAKFIDHEKVSAWLNSWRSDDEQEPTKSNMPPLFSSMTLNTLELRVFLGWPQTERLQEQTIMLDLNFRFIRS